jgi:hypothetical protein
MEQGLVEHTPRAWRSRHSSKERCWRAGRCAPSSADGGAVSGEMRVGLYTLNTSWDDRWGEKRRKEDLYSSRSHRGEKDC